MLVYQEDSKFQCSNYEQILLLSDFDKMLNKTNP